MLAVVLRPVWPSWPESDKGSWAPHPTPEGTAPGLEQSAQTENGTGEIKPRQGETAMKVVMTEVGAAAQVGSVAAY